MADKNNPGQFGNREDTQEQASKGGRAAHEKSTAHEFDSQEAQESGSKSRGGQGSGGSNAQDEMDQE